MNYSICNSFVKTVPLIIVVVTSLNTISQIYIIDNSFKLSKVNFEVNKIRAVVAAFCVGYKCTHTEILTEIIKISRFYVWTYFQKDFYINDLSAELRA